MMYEKFRESTRLPRRLPRFGNEVIEASVWFIDLKWVFAPCKGIWIPQSRNFCLWNRESWALEFRMQLKNLKYHWQLESGIKFYWRRIRNPQQSRIQDFWIPFHGAKSIWPVEESKVQRYCIIEVSVSITRDLTIPQRRRQWKRRWKIDSASFETFAVIPSHPVTWT